MSEKAKTISTSIEDHVNSESKNSEALNSNNNLQLESLNPVAIEKAIVDKEVKAEPVGIEESASLLFGLYLPKFTQVVNGLSNKSLKRLLFSLVAVPLEEARLNLKNENEKTAYAIAEQLLVSKSALIMNAAWNEENKKEKLKEAIQENLKVDEPHKT